MILCAPRRPRSRQKSLSGGAPQHYVGHNPAGALAIIGMLALILITAVAGWANLNELGGHWVEEVHELAAHALLLLVGVHLAGVLVRWCAASGNLVRNMLTGRKQADTDAPSAPQYRAAGLSGAAVLPQCCRSGLAVVFAGGRRPRHCQHSRSNNDCGRERRKRREARTPRQTLTTATLATTPNMRILLAEDDNLLGDGLRAGLRQQGFLVDWVRDGATAQRELAGGTYDAMVLDPACPARTVPEVLADARRSGLKLPILVLTARDAVPDRIGHPRCRCRRLHHQASRSIRVGARLQALVRRAHGQAEDAIEMHGLRLLPASHEVPLNGEAVTLSAREFDLLHALMLNAGRVMTRDQLERRLYSWGQEVESNAIEYHVHHLRRKLAPGLIETIRGVGYTMPRPRRPGQP